MAVLGVAVAVGMATVPAPVADAADAARGAVLFALAAGCNCHTPAAGPIGAGGGEVPTPFGTFYGTNITPDPETGIGRWSDAEIAAAIRDGAVRDVGAESPAMPYYQYAGMTDADVADLIAYLRSLPPVARENRPHEVRLPFARWAYWLWRVLLAPSVERPATTPLAGVARGRYLADHVSICTDCHTPRNTLGVPDPMRYLAGTAAGPAGERVPNITPHASGVAEWSVDDMTNLLALGMLPNFDNVQGLMAEVIDGRGGGPGYKDAPAEDRKLIAEYLRTVAPIDNVIGGE
jgi:mono/diheme cytochrome c family protein